MASFKQHADGSASIFSDQEQKGLFRVGGSKSPTKGSGENYRAPYFIHVPLNTSGQGTAALASWQNTTGDDFMVNGLLVNMTTSQTATLIINFGVDSVATTMPVNLIDSLSVTNVPIGTFDNVTDKGTNGKSRQLFPNTWFINVGTSTGGSATSFVGDLYLEVIKA